MSVNVANLEWLRKLAPQSFDDLQQIGPKLYQAFRSLAGSVSNIEQQTNTDASQDPSAPPQLQNIHVSAQNGIFHVSLTHTDEIYRGVNYHVEYADNPHFTNPFPIDMGNAREWRGSLGNHTLHFRAAVSYRNTAPSQWIYFGGATPTGVTGGGASGPTFPSLSQGSGTGLPGQGLQGPGTVAYRSSTGKLPVRSQRVGQQ